jgi:hypothetical protein
MQKFQPDSAQDKGHIGEKSLVRKDLPAEASQNPTTTTRKTQWQLGWHSLIAGGILLLVAVVVGARLLPQAPHSQPSPSTSERMAPLSTPYANTHTQWGTGSVRPQRTSNRHRWRSLCQHLS